MWLNLGWLGLAALAGWAVLVLVIWRCYWPVVVHPLGARPGAGQVAGLGATGAGGPR